MPVHYQEGTIYKIYNIITGYIYIGRTAQKLCERMRQHRQHKKTKHTPIDKAFIEHGVEHFFIELIETCPCNDNDELRRTEGKHIRELKPSLNRLIAGGTNKEYGEDNKTHIAINKT